MEFAVLNISNIGKCIKMRSADKLLSKASRRGIEVQRAKSKVDGCKGIHILNPTLSLLENAIYRCEEKELNKIVIHCIANWPYPLSKDLVVVEY